MTESHGRVFSRIVNLHFAIPFLILYLHSIRMDGVAQLVRASVCGSEGRGFETHHYPQNKVYSNVSLFLCPKIKHCTQQPSPFFR